MVPKSQQLSVLHTHAVVREERGGSSVSNAAFMKFLKRFARSATGALTVNQRHRDPGVVLSDDKRVQINRS